MADSFRIFDMTYTGDDDNWTYVADPSSSLSSSVACIPQHVRAVGMFPGGAVEIVLGSGADLSALPLHYGQVGQPSELNTNQYVDAQGNPIPVASTRRAKVQFEGSGVTFVEEFIISPIAQFLFFA